MVAKNEYIYIYESFCYIPETNTILIIIYSSPYFFFNVIKHYHGRSHRVEVCVREECLIFIFDMKKYNTLWEATEIWDLSKFTCPNSVDFHYVKVNGLTFESSSWNSYFNKNNGLNHFFIQSVNQILINVVIIYQRPFGWLIHKVLCSAKFTFAEGR